MRKLLLLSLLLASSAHAEILNRCTTIYSNSAVASSVNGSIVNLDTQYSRALTAVAVATNVSGTDPTLDVKLQTCRDTTAASCSDIPSIAFSQCTTSCYGGDGQAQIDISTNVYQKVRAVVTLGGTTPVYNVGVQVCYQ